MVELIVREYPVLRTLSARDLGEEFSDYFQEKQFDEALSVAEYAINHDPTYAGFYFDKGVSCACSYVGQVRPVA